MYIRLGKTKINYTSPDYDDFMIFAEVPDVSMSYEKPILVHTKDELDIWFGRNFKDRDYFDELLESGVTLFLYKPVSEEPNKYQTNYIDYSTYVNEKGIYYLEDNSQIMGEVIGEFSFVGLPEEGDNGILYKVIHDDGKYEVGLNSLRYDLLIWLEDCHDYIDVEDLTQNTGVNSASLSNRDVLRICKVDSDISYCYPKFGEQFEEKNYTLYYSYNRETWNLLPDVVIENPNYTAHSLKELEEVVVNPKVGDTARIDWEYSSKVIDTTNLDLEKINEGYQTLVFNYNFDNADFFQKGSYIILLNKEGKRIIIANTIGDIKEPDLLPDLSGKNKYYDEQRQYTSRESFERVLKELGYTLENGLMKASFACPVTYFYNIPGLILEPNFEETHNILSEITLGSSRIEFWSKTIGNSGIEGDISIQINSLGDDYYQFIISRYDYSEYFEGSLFENGEERIDYIISKESNLVYCKVKETYKDENGEIKYYTIDDILPEGSWVMKRSNIESTTRNSYWKSTELLFNSTILFDYFLVPNPEVYLKGLDYNSIYTTLLDYAIDKNCQILIENTKTNFSYNYIKDKKNFLIYFYNNFILSDGNYRPGYYLYLLAILGDIYSLTTDVVLYQPPNPAVNKTTDGIVINNPYENTNLVEDLEASKSNYLIENGQMYFYKSYQDGPKYETSGIMRFVLGKVARELEKKKWLFLGEHMTGKIQEKIENVINKVKLNFSVIRKLIITNYEANFYNNKIELTLETEISDLVKNHMTLDITLNVNKRIWQQ